MDLGIRLKQLRIERGLNQIDIANMLGVERSTYGKYETGDSSPDYDKLIQLSNFYQVSIDFFARKN
jgi:transcriptional regulator with XRE-family HTH domain